MQTVNTAVLKPLLACPSNSLSLPFPSVHTRPPSSHAPFSGNSLFSGRRGGWRESAGVRSWRHSCTTAPDAPHAWGKALTKPWRGNSCRQPARPSLALSPAPSPAQTSLLVSCRASSEKLILQSNFSTSATYGSSYKQTCQNNSVKWGQFVL